MSESIKCEMCGATTTKPAHIKIVFFSGRECRILCCEVCALRIEHECLIEN